MEVKIGVQYAMREIIIESAQTPDEIEKAVSAAMKSGGLLTLVDDRGRKVLVPSDRLAYIEIGEASERRVGFGNM